MNTTKTTILSIAISLISLFSFSQAAFEGVITYQVKIDMPNMPKEAAAMFDGAEAVTYIKDDKRRIDMNMGMQNTTTLIDSKEKSSTTYMDLMGMKYMIKSKESDIKNEEAEMPEYTVEYTNDTKEIAGYKCEKAIVTMKLKNGKTEKFNIYTTSQIPSVEFKGVYKGLKGYPLEYTVMKDGMKMTFTTKKISAEAVSDDKFAFSSQGYTEFTPADFKNMMKQMGAR